MSNDLRMTQKLNIKGLVVSEDRGISGALPFRASVESEYFAVKQTNSSLLSLIVEHCCYFKGFCFK